MGNMGELSIMSTYTLFGLPIYKTKIDPGSYDKKKLLSTIKKNYSLGPRNNFDQYNSNVHMSFADEGNSKFKSMDYTKLKKVYDNVFNNFVKSLNFNYKGTIKLAYNILNYTVSNKDDYMNYHNHLPSEDFACVHYLQLGKDQVGTKFKNTHSFGNYFQFIRSKLYNSMNNTDKLNSYVYEDFTLDVEEDDIIIFPSVAEHGIKKLDKLSNKLRITIATNLRLS